MQVSVYTHSSSLETVPVVLCEQQVHPFKLYFGNTMREGIRREDGFYGLVYEFDTNNRLQAYRQAWKLSQQKVAVIVTESEQRYAIWANLRSLNQLHRQKGG